jgi:hypothetical protein
VTGQTCSIERCSKAAAKRGWCRPHYRRWLRHGSPTGGAPERCRGTLADRLEKFRGRAGDADCWEWQGGANNKGYGVLQFGTNGKRKNFLAHRVAWEIANGQPIPDGLCVLHACDNPPCTNPAHLSVGTKSENTRQMWERGRR